MLSSNPQISVIIPTRNRADFLAKAIASIAEQELPPELFELIVVDNGSTDHTAQVCDKYGAKIKNFRRVVAKSPGLHEGRHLGLQVSSSPILTFADDDIEALPTWLTGVMEAFENRNVSLVGGKCLPNWEVTPPHWLWQRWMCERVEWGQKLGTLSIVDFGDVAQPVDPYLIYGCNFSVRKDTVLEAQGFHPDGMPRELILLRGDGESHISGHVKSSGKIALYHPNAAVKHLVSADRMTEDYFSYRAFIQGVSNSFAQIRKARSPEIPPGSPGALQKIKRKLIDNFLLRRDVALLAEELRLCPVLRTERSSREAGYNLHQSECRRDPELLKWVLKDSWLNLKSESSPR